MLLRQSSVSLTHLAYGHSQTRGSVIIIPALEALSFPCLTRESIDGRVKPGNDKKAKSDNDKEAESGNDRVCGSLVEITENSILMKIEKSYIHCWQVKKCQKVQKSICSMAH